MTVFKNYLKILKSYLTIIIVYTAIFVGLAMITSSSNGNNSSTYTTTDAKIAVINYDKESKFIENFEKYVDKKAEKISLKDDESSLKDALFFRRVDYIMIVPENYTKDFIAGKDVTIETMQVPDSVGATYSKTIMNKYLNTAKLYLAAGIDEDTLSTKVEEDLQKDAVIHFESIEVPDSLENAQYFYNFSNYTLLSIVIMVVAMVMVSFNEERIRRRTMVSPVSYKSVNRQLLLGNIVTSIGVWLLYVIASIILYKDAMFTTNGVLLMLNSFIFVVFALVFSYLLSQLTTSREVVSGVGNVVGLGSSFIAGSFVPQQYLGSFVLTIAKFTPSYWFIANNIKITNLSSFTMDSLQPIFMNMLIMFGFSVLIYFAIQIVGRLKLKK